MCSSDLTTQMGSERKNSISSAESGGSGSGSARSGFFGRLSNGFERR